MVQINRFVLFTLMFLFLFSYVSALELNPFADKKAYEPILREDTGDFLKESFNEKYGVIRFSKTLFWVETDKLAEYSLIENTEQCLINCEAYGKAILYKDGKLFDDLNFINRRGISLDVNAKYLIKQIETYEIEVEDTFKEICEKVESNFTKGELINNCYNVVDNYKNETREREIWVEYKGEDLTAGNYEWKVVGFKSPTQAVDFIPVARGKAMNEWAWWNGDWDYKKEIKIKENSGSDLSNYSTLMYIPYNANMESDFKDLRFVDSAETTELGYWIENKTDSSFAYVWVKIPSLTASINNTIYMYYGNTLASSNSDGESAFLWFDDGSSNRVSDYTNWDQGGTGDSLNWNAGGYYVLTGDGGGYDHTYYFDLGISTNFEFRADVKQNSLTNCGTGLGLNLDTSGNNLHMAKQQNGCGGYTGNVLGDIGNLIRYKYGGTTNTDYNNWKVQRVGTTIYTYKNNALLGSDAAQVSGTKFGMNTRMASSNSYFDNLIARSFVTSEPTYIIGEEEQKSIAITLVEPINNTILNNSLNYFVANITDEGDLGIQNVSLVINNTIYDTNTSGLTGVYNFSETLNDGFYEWYIEAYDDTNEYYTSETRYFTIDTLAPSIEILSPVTSYDYLQQNQTIDLNVSITDASDHLDSCWYEYNSSITYFNCSENQTFNYIPDQNTLTVYANDTLGNEGSESVSWSYKVLQGSIVYDNISYEGLDSSFYNFITLNGTIQSASLEYNGTNYTSSIYLSNLTYLYNMITLPKIESDVNNTFFWWIKIGDEWFKTVENVQLVKAINITNCTTSTLLNLSLKDEKLQTSLNGTLEVLLNVISQSGTEVFVYNNTFTNRNNVQFCLFPEDLDKTLFNFNAQIKYYALDYASELYNIQNANLSNYPRNLTLYDLSDNQSTKFKTTYKGNNFIPQEGVLVQLLRKYIGEDSYKVVEAPITSSLGEVILHIDQDNNLYNIIVSRDGLILDTYENIVFTCDNALVGLCNFNLDGVINPYNDISSEILNDIAFQINSINDTNIVVTFSSLSGTPFNIKLLVKENSILGESYIYNNSVYSSAGSFNVILDDDTSMGIGENIYTFTFIKDGEVIGTKSFLLNDNGMEWDSNNYFIVVILLLSVVGMAFTSPELVIFNAILTFLIAGSLWLLNGMNFAIGLGSLIWLVISAGILIYKLSQQEDK